MVTGMSFYRTMLRIRWTEHVCNKKSFTEMITKKTPMLSIRKRQLKSSGRIISKDAWENLTLTGFTEGKRTNVALRHEGLEVAESHYQPRS